MARLYADENFPRRAVEELRRLSHDVLTAFEAGQTNQKIDDDKVLEFAHAEQRAVLTYNRRHFIRLHQAPATHSGIIICTFDPDAAQLAKRIHEAIVALPELADQLVRVYRS